MRKYATVMKRHKVIIKQVGNLGNAIREIFSTFKLTDLEKRHVLVKPNMLRPARPSECVVTDPRLIAESVSFLTAAGAIVMVGDNPMPNRQFQHETDIASYCGFSHASRGTFRNIGKYPKRLKKPDNLLKELYIAREVLDCDLLISLPKFKSHELTTMSVAVKNNFGIVPGGLKPYIHALFPRIRDFSKVLVEIYETRPPDLIIVDCMNIVDAKGKYHRPNLIIAGDNGHAVDYACAIMADANPLQIPTIKSAYDDGLFDPACIEYLGPMTTIHDFSLPFSFPFRNTVVEFVARVLYRVWLGRVPVIDSADCGLCLSCENVCPTHALKDRQINYKKCIKCYCCLEVCPNQAVKLKSKLV
jgi:uncharacterized protein (DUF362 family)/NAD-dependent dihydropyrimidine dehydrogenase PreA subunit